MKLFTASSACLSGAHCEHCRDREGGRSWRESLRIAFALPEAKTDFVCPHNRPWGWVRDYAAALQATSNTINHSTGADRRPCNCGGSK